MYDADCQTVDYRSAVAYVRPFYSDNSTPPVGLEFRYFEQEPSFSNDYKEIVEKWAETFEQLNKVQQKENYNIDVQMPTESTIAKITHWLNRAFDGVPSLAAPEIVPDAEGGLDIEWDLEDRFISIHIDHSSKSLNKIFIKSEKGYSSYPLTEEYLLAVLAS